MTKVMLIKDRNNFNTKWVCNFATQLVLRGYEVVLVADSYNHSGNVQQAPLDKRVKKINLTQKTKNPFYNSWLKIRSLLPITFLRYRKLFEQEKPDIIICYFNHDLINATLHQSHNIPIMMMMHNPPNEIFANVRRGWKRFRTDKAFRRANVIQVLMECFVKEITDIYPQKKVEVIPNQVMIPDICCDLNRCHHTIIHVAQIAEQFKRQHLLVEAFAQIADKFPEWKVLFFGKVKRRHKRYFKRLLKRVKELGLEDRLIFKGFSHNITEEYLNSDIVTLPSFSEGFGYGLADGLAIGLPGIGFEYAPAINELILNNKTGYLVKDVDDYADKLAKLMSDKELRLKMGKAARKDMERYAPQIIIDKWIELIEKTIKNFASK